MSQISPPKKAFLLAYTFLLKHYTIFAIVFTIISISTQFGAAYLVEPPLASTELGLMRFVVIQLLMFVWIPALFLILHRSMQRKMNK